jgi:hypothetical protein
LAGCDLVGHGITADQLELEAVEEMARIRDVSHFGSVDIWNVPMPSCMLVLLLRGLALLARVVDYSEAAVGR